MNIYFTIYEVTNKINNRKYRGAHQTTDPNDSYLGSGTYIKRAIRKYGKNAFVKEIIFNAFSESDLYLIEQSFVDEAWVKNPTTYNAKIGGIGGAGSRSIETRASISSTLKGKPKPLGFGEKISLSYKDRPRSPTRPKGTINSIIHNSRISSAKTGKPSHQSTCPHCGKTGGTGAMSRHHFNNCKSFKTNEVLIA